MSVFQHPFLRRVGANLGWLASGVLARTVTAFAVAAVLARYLGAEGYGLLSYATMFVGMFSAVTAFGLERILVRELIKQPDRQGQILGTAVLLRLLGALLTAGLVMMTLPLLATEQVIRQLAMIYLLGLPFAAGSALAGYFDARVESRFPVLARTLAMWAGAGAKISFAVLALPLLVFPLGDVLRLGLTALVLFVLFKLRGGPALGVDWALARQLSRQSLPLVLVGVVYAIQLRVDQVMLKAYLGVDAVGIYAASLKLYEAWLVLPAILSTSLLPRIVASHKQSEERFSRDIRRFYYLLSLVAWPISLLVFLLAPWLVVTVFGDAFGAAVWPLQIHIWALPFIFLNFGRTQWAITVGQQHWQAVLVVWALLLKLGLNWWLIPKMGVAGASLALLLSVIGYSLLGPWLLNSLQREQAGLMLRAACLVGARREMQLMYRNLKQSVAK